MPLNINIFMNSLIDIGLGLLMLGVGLGILDVFIFRGIKKIYPNSDYWSKENYERLELEDRKHWEYRKRLYQAYISHRFLKLGGIVFLLGALLITIHAVLQHF